ncbi:MAG: O-antigen ligase family protein [Patescibacteria group bacterium]|nr:O-antigen ligase family protein [Patescibacteria group bacterium]
MSDITNLLKNNKIQIFLAILIIEILSLISFKITWLSGIFFVLICLGVLILTWRKLENGVLIALAELIIGSQGYLFYLMLPGFKVSIRLGIFLIVFFVWLFKYFNFRNFLNLLRKDRLVQNFILLLVFIAFGAINGLIHKNGASNVFFDLNGYLYFGLFFVFLDAFKDKELPNKFINVLLAALTYVSLEIFFTLYIFSHSIPYLPDLFYHWIRDTRVGEITYAGANFFRVFFQSQIWTLESIFIILCILLLNKKSKWLYILLIFLQTSILISFARSFWLGGAVAMAFLFGYLIYTRIKEWQKLLKNIGLMISAAILSVVLIFAIANFPLPKPTAYFTADMLVGRFTLFSDAAASSRWQELPVILEKIKTSPIFGAGFGSTITYKTEDPRIKNTDNPEGWYTTYTFEWGFLDTITEIGIIGLLVYLVFIGQIFYLGLKGRGENWLKIGLLLGLIALVITNISSPYLNHPLGIGYLLLCAGIFESRLSD